MANLYQLIRDVSGKAQLKGGTDYAKQKELYSRLGSPQGNYAGTRGQNMFLLQQIAKGNFGLGQAAPAAPQQADTQALAGTAPQLRKSFNEVLPFDTVFNDNLVTGLAESQINPEIQRQSYDSMNNLNRNLAQSGAYRTGGANYQRGSLSDAYERQRKEQVGQFSGQIKNYATDWYNRQYEDYNKNPAMFAMPSVPSANEFLKTNPGLAQQYNQQTSAPTTYTNPYKF